MKRIWVPILALALLLPSVVYAAGVDISDAPVIRKPLEWRKGRFGLSPVVGMTGQRPLLDLPARGRELRLPHPRLARCRRRLPFWRGVHERPVRRDRVGSRDLPRGGHRRQGRGRLRDDCRASSISRRPTSSSCRCTGMFVAFDSFEMATTCTSCSAWATRGIITFPEDADVRQGGARHGSVAPVAGVGLRFFFNSWFRRQLRVPRLPREHGPHRSRVPAGQGSPRQVLRAQPLALVGFTFLLPTEIDNAAD